jgi:hypothetical protein
MFQSEGHQGRIVVTQGEQVFLSDSEQLAEANWMRPPHPHLL